MTVRRVRGCDRGGRLVCRHPVDTSDRAAVEVRVIEVAVRADPDVDRVRRSGVEGDPRRRIGEPAGSGEHDPDAITGVIGEEESTVVGVRERSPRVERETCRRRAPGRAGLAGNDLGAVVVRVERARHCSRTGAVEALADVEVSAVVAALARSPLVARPTEVVDTVERIRGY